MILGNFEINGVTIKTPNALTVSTRIEKQTHTLLNGTVTSRVKKIRRVVELEYSMIKEAHIQAILAQTLKRAVEQGLTTVTIKYMDEFSTAQTITAEFNDISLKLVAESLKNGRWSDVDTLTFTEV